ncbi:MAG: arginine utilization regulatory protein [Clostridiales bacterium]|nr:arginine utilization regulatory protein [Clostridiales bacterium]
MHPLMTLEHLKMMLEHISDGVQIVDREGRLIYCNRISAMLDDINISDSIGKHITEVYPSLNEKNSTLLRALNHQASSINREQTYRTYKGKVIATVNTTLPILERGSIEGAIEISRDITSYKELSERYLDLQVRLKDKKKGKHTSYRPRYEFEDILTEDSDLIAVKTLARKASALDIPVLIFGDTGTGKELLAQSIHNAGERREMPFIAQNCAALPASLLEGILFGTVKGGFTDAVDREGLFEVADGGTLFLDEINSMPQELQAKLLRALQDGIIRRVGSTKEIQVDVRIIAATNIEPNLAMDLGLLRRDLYYRLNAVTLILPPLADRKSDIPLLTEHFINKFNARHKRTVEGISPAVLSLFKHYPWPGNVRELEHVLESAVSFCEEEWVDIRDLPQTLKKFVYPEEKRISTEKQTGKTLTEQLESAEREAIRSALEDYGGNVSKAARQLGLPRQTLQYKIKKYQLS